jgi:8-oxo-dGTP pyrophosphatase MutT (NUDIX family)
MIDETEVVRLACDYGDPRRLHYTLEVGPSLFLTRFQRHADRRGEVVLALERRDGRLVLHRKAHYREDVFRLLSGGVGHGEPVIEAVVRETEEETGLQVQVEQFVALLSYTFRFGGIDVPFVSYVFHLRETAGRFSPDWLEIDQVREVWPHQLPEVAGRLRGLDGDRADWGRWRAIAHDVVAEELG